MKNHVTFIEIPCSIFYETYYYNYQQYTCAMKRKTRITISSFAQFRRHVHHNRQRGVKTTLAMHEKVIRIELDCYPIWARNLGIRNHVSFSIPRPEEIKTQYSHVNGQKRKLDQKTSNFTDITLFLSFCLFPKLSLSDARYRPIQAVKSGDIQMFPNYIKGYVTFCMHIRIYQIILSVRWV